MENQQVIPSDQWYVVIRRDNGQRPATYAFQPAGPDLEQARRHAVEVALRHKPQLLGRSRGRQVFQIGPDRWVVAVANAMAGRVYFEVYVGRLTATAAT